jgi:hypothetical protein
MCVVIEAFRRICVRLFANQQLCTSVTYVKFGRLLCMFVASITVF